MADIAVQGAPGGVRFSPLASLSTLVDPGRTLIVTDRRIHALFGSAFPPCPIAFVPEGEAAKSWEVLGGLYRRLTDIRMDRDGLILAIGGGSISDLAGFAAHTWMRGIAFAAAPTTLLAMTDASLGGKNAIDFEGYKNVVGSFHQPEAVICDIETLRALDGAQFSSGMAEVVKHAVIDGEEYFSFLEATLSAAGGSGFNHESCSSAALRRMVADSQRVKLAIVARDPTEKGERRILNLGHTFGHAVEIVTGAPHGHAVSIGLRLACAYSVARGDMAEAAKARIESLLKGYGLPVRLSETASGAVADGGIRKAMARRIAEALVMDKKRSGGIVHFVIPRAIGEVSVERVAVGALAAFLEEVEL
ncbi:3-dehydroquinate synthase [bacterium]|nr:3-dehydroquinate synthase [bacterium]